MKNYFLSFFKVILKCWTHAQFVAVLEQTVNHT